MLKPTAKTILISVTAILLNACGADSNKESNDSINKWTGNWSGLNALATPENGSFIYDTGVLSELYIGNVMLEDSVQLTSDNDHLNPEDDGGSLIDLDIYKDGNHALLVRSHLIYGAESNVGIFQKDGNSGGLDLESINGNWEGEWAFRSKTRGFEEGALRLSCLDLSCLIIISEGTPILVEFITRTSFPGLWISYSSGGTDYSVNLAASPDGKALGGSLCYESAPEAGQDILDICLVMGMLRD